MSTDEKQFAWAEVMATGKGVFHDFPTAIGKTSITFNRFGVVTLDGLQWVRWRKDKKGYYKYDIKIGREDFQQLKNWPVITRQAEPTYRKEELQKITYDGISRREKRLQKRAKIRKKRPYKQQQKILDNAIKLKEQEPIAGH